MSEATRKKLAAREGFNFYKIIGRLPHHMRPISKKETPKHRALIKTSTKSYTEHTQLF